MDHIDSVAVYNEEKGEVTVFAVNRNMEDDVEVDIDLRSYGDVEVIERILYVNDDIKAHNSAEVNIAPVTLNDVKAENGCMKVTMPKVSWNVIRCKVK